MKRIIIFSFVFLILIFNVFSAYAQQPQLASYREIAQIFVDEKIQNQTTAFITLSTTSTLEMRVPEQLDQKIHNNGNITSISLPHQIRNGGGFVDAAKKMASNSNSTVTFAIVPEKNISIYQLQVARHFPIKNQIDTISPLDLFELDKLDRSSYFNAGFFPLNSILQVTLLSNQSLTITNHGGGLVPTVEKNGQNLPADLTKAGWLFDPSSGNHITAVYLFGTTFSASKNDLMLTIGNTTAGVENPIQPVTPTPPKPAITDSTSYVLVGIVAAAGIAIYIFLRKR